jgi:DNA-binding YbaB/EbfC family protein
MNNAAIIQPFKKGISRIDNDSFLLLQRELTMFDMMKKLQQAQEEMKKIKDRLENITVEGQSPGGAIKVRVNGNRKVKGITFADEGLVADKEQLEDFLILAMNDALQKAEQVNESEMKSAASSMMPGLGGLFK